MGSRVKELFYNEAILEHTVYTQLYFNKTGSGYIPGMRNICFEMTGRPWYYQIEFAKQNYLSRFQAYNYLILSQIMTLCNCKWYLSTKTSGKYIILLESARSIYKFMKSSKNYNLFLIKWLKNAFNGIILFSHASVFEAFLEFHVYNFNTLLNRLKMDLSIN